MERQNVCERCEPGRLFESFFEMADGTQHSLYCQDVVNLAEG